MSMEDVPLPAQSHGSARLFTRRGCLCSVPLRERALKKKRQTKLLGQIWIMPSRNKIISKSKWK